MATISINVRSPSINAVIRSLSRYANDLQRKANELAKRLAEMGAVNVSLGYARAIYNGTNDISVTVEQPDINRYAIRASGEVVLFVEFGAGVTYGYGHPQAAEFGYGPGTYNPSSNNWSNPKGWWYAEGGQSYHTYGNPPSMVMYNTAKDLEREIERVAREVFEA